MGDELSKDSSRGVAATSVWTAKCKDCETEERNRLRTVLAKGERQLKSRGRTKERSGEASTSFEYSDDWTHRLLDRGNTRSDRCERHRHAHRAAIQALSVAYIDLQTIGAVSDPNNPTGPLGGLGPLPMLHHRTTRDVNLAKFKMGMGDDDIRNLLTGLARRRVAIVEAGTGTGKSTLMPFRLMNPPPDAVLRLNDFGPIIVTEPRKAAATGIARFVGEAMCFGHDPKTCNDHIGPGFPVGYQVSGDRKWDSACQLIYVTDGTMINWVGEGRLANMSTVIVDEAHERSENIDIILAQLRDQVTRYPHLRVIVTSATMDKNFFSEFFGGDDAVHYQFIAAQKNFGYGVPLFIGADISGPVIEQGLKVERANGAPAIQFDGWPEADPAVESGKQEDLRSTTCRLRELRRQETIPMEHWVKQMPSALAEQVVKIASGTDFGDILGFLPTTESIKTAVGAIEEALQKKGLDFDVYPLLSTVPADIRDKAIEARSRGDKRKIVVSSNLAETSLTVEGVRYVVDSGLICQPEWDPSIANGSFPTKPHSQSGVRQRWGRVGRDSPGWVFPLYSLEQFLKLPQNTPPGSTRTNLETFYMKLLAAGLEPDKVVLPANFEHPNVKYDEDASRSVQTFNRESERAIRALATSGAVDADGHLTDFGRELVRFPGSGAEAMAMMLADQLACVHEVALALTVLNEGRFVGHKGEIFRVARDWPNAWRVHAARCHRALVAGCEDDLDVLVRVFAEWQAQAEPARWCANWWLNHEVLEEVESSMADLITSLSAGMKSRVERPVRPELVCRARAVITRAMGSQRYHRFEGNRYRHATSIDAETMELSHVRLVDPGDQIIVLSSFRPPPERNTGEARLPIISTAIRAVDWIDAAMTGSDEMGFDLILQAAVRLRDNYGNLIAPQDPLAMVRNHYPVGASFDIRVGEEQCSGTFVVQDIARVADPFPYPGNPANSSAEESLQDVSLLKKKHQRSIPSGFDPDWEWYSNPNPQVPEEETAQAIIDVTLLETNDELPPRPTVSEAPDEPYTPEPKTETNVPWPGLWLKAEGSSILPHGQLRVVVLGYDVTEHKTPILLVEMITEQQQSDPARHPDLSYWDSLEVVVSGVVSDHEDEFLQLARSDGRGHFYLESLTRGVDANDREFIRRLHPGAKINAHVIPGWRHDQVTVTLLPMAFEHISLSPAEQHNVGRQLARFLPATIAEEPNQWGTLVVELDHRDESKGVIHRFEAKMKLLRGWDEIRAEKGQRLLVELRGDLSKYRKTLTAGSEQCFAIAARYEDYLQIVDGKIRRTDKRLPFSIVSNLLGVESSEAWKRNVWLFYADTYHLSIAAVRPITCHSQLRVPTGTTALLAACKDSIVRRRRVSIQIDLGEDVVKIVGTDPQAIQAASEEIQHLTAGGEIWAVVARTEPYGVLVSTLYGDGLLHISNIADGYFPSERIEAVFSLSSPLLVKIQSFDNDRHRFSLGLTELRRMDGSVTFGRFAKHPDDIAAFLSSSRSADWSQLATWAQAFGIDEPTTWAAVSGLDLTAADSPGSVTALRLLEYTGSVRGAHHLKVAVLRLESLIERIAPKAPSAVLSPSLSTLLTEASRNMSRTALDRWMSTLTSEIERATGALNERLNQIERAYTDQQSMALEMRDVLKIFKDTALVPAAQSGACPSPDMDPQPSLPAQAKRMPQVPSSQPPSASTNAQTCVIELNGSHGFHRTYYDSVILNRSRLSGAATRDALRILSGTGLKLHVRRDWVEACMLPNCPECIIDGISLVVGELTQVTPGLHHIKLADIDLELNITALDQARIGHSSRVSE